MHRGAGPESGRGGGCGGVGKVSFISSARGYPSDGGDFEFFSPPDAPIFRPTEEEFARGPIAYVASIRAAAEPFGICRIVPPAVSISVVVFDSRVTVSSCVSRMAEFQAAIRGRHQQLCLHSARPATERDRGHDEDQAQLFGATDQILGLAGQLDLSLL